MRTYKASAVEPKVLNFDEETAARIIRLLLDTPMEKRFDTLVVVIKWAVERQGVE